MDVGVWQANQIAADVVHHALVGPLELWVKRVADELHIAVKRHADPDGASEAHGLAVDAGVTSADLSWARWVIGKDESTVRLAPATPDRPVVVRPEVPLRLPSKKEALFFVNFPIWVRVVVGAKRGVKLCEKPCISLSKTWFGDPTSGSLCYSMRTRARRAIEDIQPRPHRAVCPVMIRNSSEQQLDLERICVHVEHLTLYQGVTRLWANQVDVTFRGDSEISQLSYAKRPPTYEAVSDVMCEARRPVKESLLARSLGSLGLFGDEGGQRQD